MENCDRLVACVPLRLCHLGGYEVEGDSCGVWASRGNAGGTPDVEQIAVRYRVLSPGNLRKMVPSAVQEIE